MKGEIGWMWSVLYITLFLVSTILIHEYAHYKTGMLLGINPVEVGLGFGPTLYQKELKAYTFKVKLLPLGGYVSYGKNMFEEKVFYEAPAWKRFLITLAGPVSNILYAFVLLFVLQLYYTHMGGGLDLSGIFTSFVDASKETVIAGVEVTKSTAEYFSTHTGTEIAKTIQGPVGAYKVLMMYTKHPEYMVIVFALVNISLALFNLFPFPALDGYTVLTSLIEMVTGKRFNMKVATMINVFGFVVVMGVSIVLLLWDVVYQLLWNFT